jgi:hypothetical protein
VRDVVARLKSGEVTIRKPTAMALGCGVLEERIEHTRPQLVRSVTRRQG